MPATYTLIASNTLSSSAASVTFSSIPNTYTDLVLRCSVRSTDGTAFVSSLSFTHNGTQTYSSTRLTGNGATAASARRSNISWGVSIDDSINGGTSTSNTFSSVEIYIPSYGLSSNKPSSTFATMEANNTTAYMGAYAGLTQNGAAITSITIESGGTSIASGSSFFLYGIKNS